MKRKVEAGVSAALKNVKSSSSKVENKFLRSFDHVDGNWPSHIVFSGKCNIHRVSKLCCLHFAENFPNHALTPIEDPHLSLSKAFVLRSHQIQSFVSHLGSLLNTVESFSTVVHSSHQVFLNDNQTRLFLALPVDDPSNNILKVVRRVDEVLTMFRQPIYYADPRFHISIASRPILTDEEREVAVSTAGRHVSVPVGREFLQAHEHELSGYDNAEDSDDEADVWNNASSLPHALSVAGDRPAVAVATKPSTVLGGLLDGYNSHSDDDSIPAACIAGVGAGADASSILQEEVVPALSKVITFNAVECKIGNRVFRLELLNSLDTGRRNGAKNVFYEVFTHSK